MTLDSEKDLSELDDVADRTELRDRYEILLQEVRVSLPGVQILLAFLLTVAFSQRFADLDVWGRRAYGVALLSSTLSAVCLLTPTLLHRLGDRTARVERLRWSVRMQVAGLALLGVALLAALWGITRFVFGGTTAWWMTIPTTVFLLASWLALPLSVHHRRPAQMPSGSPDRA